MCCLLDISMPDQGGIDALAAIKARRPDLPVSILSGFSRSRTTPPRCCGRGASGYLNKECDPEEIATAIRNRGAWPALHHRDRAELLPTA